MEAAISEIAPRPGKISAVCEHAFEIARRLFETTQRQMRIPPLIQGFDIAGPYLQSPGIGRDCFVAPAKLRECASTTRPGVGILRLRLKHAIAFVKGFVPELQSADRIPTVDA